MLQAVASNMPRKLLWYRLKTLIIISLIWILFGVVFFENLLSRSNDLGVHVSLFRFALVFGVIGFIITAILIFFLKPAFNHLPVWLSLLFKKLRIVRMVDRKRNTLVYLTYSDRLIEGSPKNSIRSSECTLSVTFGKIR